MNVRRFDLAPGLRVAALGGHAAPPFPIAYKAVSIAPLDCNSSPRRSSVLATYAARSTADTGSRERQRKSRAAIRGVAQLDATMSVQALRLS